MPTIQGFHYPDRPQSVYDAYAKAALARAERKSGARTVTGGIRRPTDRFSQLLQRKNMPSRPKRGKPARSKPVKRKSTKKRKRLAPRGSFKKPKKVRKISPKYHNHRYEQEGTCNSTKPYMYVGVNNCFHRGAIWDAMADALLRPILAKEFKFYPVQDTDKIGNMLAISTAVGISKRVLVFGMKRVGGTSGVTQFRDGLDADADLSTLRVDFDDTTYETQRTRVSAILQYWADANVSSGTTNVAPASDRVAYFPYKYTMVSDIGTDAATTKTSAITSFDHVGDTKIDLRFSQTMSFVNRTLAEGGSVAGQNLDRLGTNPLKGKLYEFTGAAPRILDHVDMGTTLRTQIQSDSTGGMAKYMTTNAETAGNAHLAHPLSSKFWLKNCSKETNIMLQPGQTKSHSSTYAIKGKISTLIERFYFAGYDKGTFGSSLLFMFDMVHKSGNTTVDPNIAPQFPTTTYKRLCRVQSYGKLSTPKLYIPDYEAVTSDL